MPFVVLFHLQYILLSCLSLLILSCSDLSLNPEYTITSTEAASKLYKLSFNKGNISKSITMPKEQSHPAGTHVKLPILKYSDDDYKFYGWKDEDGNMYIGTSIFQIPAKSTKLTAQWTQSKKFILSFSKGNISQSITMPKEQSYKAGTQVKLPTLKYSGDDYMFYGWKDENGSMYIGASTFQIPEKSVKLTAQWTQSKKITLSFRKGDIPVFSIVVMPKTQYHIAGTQVKLPILIDDADEYDFMGWKDENGNSYRGTSTFQMPAHDATLTARWAPF